MKTLMSALVLFALIFSGCASKVEPPVVKEPTPTGVLIVTPTPEFFPHFSVANETYLQLTDKPALVTGRIYHTEFLDLPKVKTKRVHLRLDDKRVHCELACPLPDEQLHKMQIGRKITLVGLLQTFSEDALAMDECRIP